MLLCYETYTDCAENQEHACDNHHIGLDSTAELQYHSAKGCRYNLWKTDSAVEQAEVTAHMLSAQGIGQQGEWKCKHRSPSSSDKEIRKEENVLVVDEGDRDETDGSEQQAHDIG